jgi:hypothetical protein
VADCGGVNCGGPATEKVADCGGPDCGAAATDKVACGYPGCGGPAKATDGMAPAAGGPRAHSSEASSAKR